VIVLASASPRRKELLERVGLAIVVRPADVDESELAGEAPDAYVLRVSKAKAAAGAAAAGGDAWVVAADTTVTIDGAILAKAADGAEAHAMLARLVGKTHAVMTAFAIRGPGGIAYDEVVTTEVTMAAVSDAVIAQYVASGEWRGKAGAYALQGIAAALVVGVRGSVTNVIGLPLAEVCAALARLGGPAVDLAAGTAA
jgi:septum formation protein